MKSSVNMEQSNNSIALIFLSLSFSNLLIIFLHLWVGLIYPYSVFVSDPDRVVFGVIFIGYLMDLVLVTAMLISIRDHVTQDRIYRILLVLYIIVGFLARMLVAAVASGLVIDETVYLTPAMAALSNLIFSAFLYMLRGTKFGTFVRNHLSILITLNVIAGFSLSGIPGVVFTVLLGEIFSIIPLLIGGLIKVISTLYASVLYFILFRRLINADETTITDLAWPELDGASR